MRPRHVSPARRAPLASTLVFYVIVSALAGCGDAKTAADGTPDAGGQGAQTDTGTQDSSKSSDTYVDPKTDRFVLSFGGVWDDEARGVAVGTGGEIAVAGYTQSAGQGDWDALVVRMSGCGKLDFARTYGGEKQDEARAVELTADGGVIFVGQTSSYSKAPQAWLVKTASDGAVQWSRVYGGGGHDVGQAVTITDDGYAALAETYNFGPGTPENHNMLVFRTDKKGAVVWEKTLGGGKEGDAGFAILALGDQQGHTEGIMIGGATESYSAGHDDVWLVRMNDAGVVAWSRAIGGPQDDELRALSQTPDGGFVATGFTRSFSAQKSDAFALRTDGDGNVRWFRNYGGPEREIGYGIFASAGGYLLAGHTSSYGFGYEDGFVMRLNADGKPVWWRTLGGKSGEQLVDAQLVAGGLVMVGRSSSFQAKRQRDVLVMRADASGDTLCGFADLPVDQLAHSKATPTVGVELPTEVTGMKAASVDVISAPIAELDSFAVIECAGGVCAK